MSNRISNYIKSRLFADEYEELREVFNVMANAVQMGRLGERDFGHELDQIMVESDSPFVTEIIQQRRRLFYMRPTQEADRTVSIREAYWFSSHNNNIKLANRLWRAFAFGVQASITSTNPKAKRILEDFQKATYNQKVLGVRHQHEISDNALNEGELAFALWYSPLDGEVPMIRGIHTLGLKPIYDPLQENIEVYYRAKTDKGVFLYPDWLATDEQLLRTAELYAGRATLLDKGIVTNGGEIAMIDGNTEIDPKTANYAKMVFAQRNVDQFINRGMPQFANGFVWADILRSYMGDIAAVARKAAMYTDKVTVDGGSRHVKDVASRLGARFDGLLNTNPEPAAGSDWIENEKIAREWMNRPTNAGEARWTGQILAGQLSVVTGVPLQWAGFPWAMNNRSVAENVMVPWLEEIKLYNVWGRSVFEDIGKAVLSIYDAANNTTLAQDADVMVVMQTPLNIDTEFVLDLMSSILDAMRDGTVDSDKAGVVVNVLVRMILAKIGVDQADTMSLTGGLDISQEEAEMIANGIEQYAQALAKGKIEQVDFNTLVKEALLG